MKNLKKVLCATLAILMLLSLFVGCAKENSSGSAAPSTGNEKPSEPADSTNTDTGNAAGADSTADVVKIGVLLPLSGPTSYNGEQQLAGIQLYTEFVNSNGGISSLNGAKIELVVADSAGSPETGLTEFERLITSENVSAVIGPYNSTVAAVTAPLAIQNEVPYIITNATAENFMNEPNKFVYRTNTGSMDGDVLMSQWVNYLSDQMPDRDVERVAIVYDSGDWGTAALSTWQGLSESMGFELSVAEAVSNATDLSTLVNKIKKADVDLVVLAIFLSDTNLFVRQMYEYECYAPIFGIGGGIVSAEYIPNCGEAAEYTFMATPWVPSFSGVVDAALEWNEKFKEKFGMDMTQEGSWGWLGMGTLCDAIERAGSTDRIAIADALYVTDIGTDHPAMWFSIYEGVHFATDGQDNPMMGEGAKRYNNNDRLGITAGLIIAQVQNQEWKLVFPETETGGKKVIIYPNPRAAQ
ncbi:MAG: ABC transporter substrate-binding protein [Oscillospiraceae bacterium]